MNRNFKLNLAGNIASTMAGVLYNFCTGLFILDITGSALHGRYLCSHRFFAGGFAFFNQYKSYHYGRAVHECDG